MIVLNYAINITRPCSRVVYVHLFFANELANSISTWFSTISLMKSLGSRRTTYQVLQIELYRLNQFILQKQSTTFNLTWLNTTSKGTFYSFLLKILNYAYSLLPTFLLIRDLNAWRKKMQYTKILECFYRIFLSFRGRYTNLKIRIMIFIILPLLLDAFLDPNISNFSDLLGFVTLHLASTLCWHTNIWSQHVFQILLLL